MMMLMHVDVFVSNSEAIVKYLQIDPAHLLVNEFGQASVYQPAYLIFYHKETNSIIISIRGSMVMEHAYCGFYVVFVRCRH